MHAKYEVYTYNGSKVIAKVKVDNKQTNRQTNRQTDKQTDRTKTICPRSFDHSNSDIQTVDQSIEGVFSLSTYRGTLDWDPSNFGNSTQHTPLMHSSGFCKLSLPNAIEAECLPLLSIVSLV